MDLENILTDVSTQAHRSRDAKKFRVRVTNDPMKYMGRELDSCGFLPCNIFEEFVELIH